jgi:hypothetical protein
MAWQSVMGTLAQFEIIDVNVKPNNDKLAPPQYTKENDPAILSVNNKNSSSIGLDGVTSSNDCGQCGTPSQSMTSRKGVTRRWIEKLVNGKG